MLYSYKNVPQKDLPGTAAAFVQATNALHVTDGMVLGPEALKTYFEETGLDRDITNLINAVTDPASKERVDVEIKRRVVTGKIPASVAAAITEIVDVLGMHSTELTVAEIPLCIVLYVDGATITEAPVVINITGAKGLADALRLVWSKIFVSPYPDDVRSSVVVYRMPPVEVTAVARVVDERVVVRAVRGWGLLVGEDSGFDEYVLDSNTLRVVEARVGRQERMVARNDRTGEVVLTTPRDGAAQKLTEEQVRGVASDVKRAGVGAAVFGVSGDRRWLLRVLRDVSRVDARVAEEVAVVDSSTFVPEKEEVVQVDDDVIPPESVGVSDDAVVDDVVSHESAGDVGDAVVDEVVDVGDVAVVDDVPSVVEDVVAADAGDVFVEESDAEEVVVNDTAPVAVDVPVDEEVDAVAEPVVEDVGGDDARVDDEYVRAEYARQPEDVQVEGQRVEDVVSSTSSFQQAQQLSTALLMQCLKTIELVMREWLWDKQQPDNFRDLVERVASKRVVPYKDRILTLFEMKQSAAFSEPEADSVRFALETMQRFVREF